MRRPHPRTPRPARSGTRARPPLQRPPPPPGPAATTWLRPARQPPGSARADTPQTRGHGAPPVGRERLRPAEVPCVETLLRHARARAPRARGTPTARAHRRHTGRGGAQPSCVRARHLPRGRTGSGARARARAGAGARPVVPHRCPARRSRATWRSRASRPAPGLASRRTAGSAPHAWRAAPSRPPVPRPRVPAPVWNTPGTAAPEPLGHPWPALPNSPWPTSCRSRRQAALNPASSRAPVTRPRVRAAAHRGTGTRPGTEDPGRVRALSRTGRAAWRRPLSCRRPAPYGRGNAGVAPTPGVLSTGRPGVPSTGQHRPVKPPGALSHPARRQPIPSHLHDG